MAIFTNLTPMPPGLTLQADGKITGTPTASFNGSVTVRATEGAAQATGNVQFSINLPGVPAPPVQQQLAYEGFTTPTLKPGSEVKTIDLFATPTLSAVQLAPAINYSDFTTPTMADPLVRYSDFTTPFLSRSGAGAGFSPTIATPQGTAGLTQIASVVPDDDTFRQLPDIGFDFLFWGVNQRANVYASSNSYLTFGAGSSQYNGFSETSPGAGLFVGAADRSWLSLWAGGTANSYRIRWEGNSSSSPNAVDSVWEVTLFPNGVIMLVTGSIGGGGGYSQIQSGAAGQSIAFTMGPDNSWVFTPQLGLNYTVQNGSYS